MRHRAALRLKRWSASALLITITILAACRPTSGLNAELNRLSAEFKTANQASAIKPMLALYHLDGSDERTTKRLKSALHYELGLPIKRIEFEPLSGAAEETIEFTHDGIAYGPSLPPSYRMRVTYAGKDQFTSLFTIGKSPSGAWRIICAKPIATVNH
jgi:hypothetical protein